MRLTREERKMLQYIRHYPDWVNKVDTLADMRSAITYDADRVQSSPSDDGLLEIAIQIEYAQDRIDWVEKSLRRVYNTDEKVSFMRQVWCYGYRKGIDHNKIYRGHKMFASELLRTYQSWESELVKERRDERDRDHR